jgi:hypothetical protein
MDGPPKGLAEGGYAGFFLIPYNNSVINKILQLLVFLTNRSPIVKKWWSKRHPLSMVGAITYDWVYKNYKNNNLTRFYFILTIMWSLPYGAKRIAQYGRSRATLDATGRHHWALGKYLPRIAPADATGINFGVKIKLWCCEFAVPKLAFKRLKTNPLLSSSKQQAA